MSRILLPVAIGMTTLVGCGAPPPASSPVSSREGVSAAPVATVSPPVPDAPPAGTVTFQQRIDETTARLKLEFSNPSKRSCQLNGYTVTWGGNRHKTVTIKDLVLPPGETRDRWIKLEGDEAEAARLPMESLSVSLSVECK